MRRKRRRLKLPVVFELPDGTTFKILRMSVYKLPVPAPKRPWKLPYNQLSKARR